MTQDIKDKIRKLLSLAASDNPYEAQLAAQRAVELMNRYGLSEGDLNNEPYTSSEIDNPYIRIPEWYRSLWRVMSECAGCAVLWKRVRNKRGTLVVFGRRCDVDNALFLVDCLCREIENRAKLPVKGRNDYLFGFVEGVGYALEKAQKEFFINHKDDNGKALVPADTRAREAMEELEKIYKDIVGNTIALPKSISFNRGVKDGAMVKLRKGINDNSATFASMLDRPMKALERPRGIGMES